MPRTCHFLSELPPQAAQAWNQAYSRDEVDNSVNKEKCMQSLSHAGFGNGYFLLSLQMFAPTLKRADLLFIISAVKEEKKPVSKLSTLWKPLSNIRDHTSHWLTSEYKDMLLTSLDLSLTLEIPLLYMLIVTVEGCGGQFVNFKEVENSASYRFYWKKYSYISPHYTAILMAWQPPTFPKCF